MFRISCTVDKVGTAYRLYAGSVSSTFYRGLLNDITIHFSLAWDLKTTKGTKQWSIRQVEKKCIMHSWDYIASNADHM